MTTQHVVFWDIDGTLVSVGLERVFIRYLRLHGVISVGSMARSFLSLAVRLPFPKWYQLKLCYLRDMLVTELNHHAESCWQDTLRSLMFPGAEESIRRFTTQRARQVLLSGTIRPLAEQVGRHLGISEIIAAEPETHNGVCTGRTVAEHPYGPTKVTLAEAWLTRNKLPWSSVISIANHWQDRFLLEKSGVAIAAHPDDKLRKHAITKGWHIVDGLSEITSLQLGLE